ncbi:hypothetical protein BCR44DRAFT_1495107 [Catenaria anguillulae PL171]|uniref:DNA primase n=1 Tax=Catenaria anguillulae PL171 TaxID=765915 RepID=A0A1Y2I5T6_9FUNG|nr:hypothetical protein BCR44DRAFT_1495107 [Catenaria anguillulae PL171]
MTVAASSASASASPMAAIDAIDAMDIDRPSDTTITTPAQPTSAAANVDVAAESMELLDTFYRRFFPFKEYARWLSYGSGPTTSSSSSSSASDSYLARREFSFTLKNDIYIRFQSFDSIDTFKTELLRLQPVKIDIGAVYNVAPKLKKSIAPAAFQPHQKELVVDIDMTDYDDLRTCCTGGAVCRKCWPLMAAAQRVLDAALRDDFGFKHILWVFSGRRGIHGWVCDEAARKLTNEARAALVKYLDVVKGQEGPGGKKVHLPAVLHPTLQRAFDTVIQPAFVKTVLVNQQILAVTAAREKVLAAVPDVAVATKIRAAWDKIERDGVPVPQDPTSSDDEYEDEEGDNQGDTCRMAKAKWHTFTSMISAEAKSSSRKSVGGGTSATSSARTTMPRDLARDLMFQYMYPRLDANVSTHINHLLKSPFCVHPKTGKVCVPIDPDTCEEFDPTSVPTVVDLVRELDESMELESDVPDWAKTSLKPYMEHFRAFVGGLEAEIRRQARLANESSLEF